MDSTSRRVVLVLPILVALQAISTDLYLPALPSIVLDLETTIPRVQLTLSAFLVGFALAQLAYGPLSDRFGRRPLLLVGTGLYAVASLACMAAGSIEALILCRVVQAVGACSGAVLGRAVIRDLYEPQDGARVLAYMATAMSVAPALGPVLGGWLTVAYGWRATFAALALFGAAALLGVLLVLPETNRRRDPAATRPGAIAASYLEVLGDRTFLARVAVAACGYGGIFVFISGSSHLLIDVVGLAPHLYGLCFGAAVVGWAIGAFASARLNARLGLQGLLRVGARVCAAAGLLGLAAALGGPPGVVGVVAPMALFMAGAGFAVPAANGLAVGSYPEKAGVASAALGCVQLSAAALTGVLVSLAYDRTAVPMMAALAVLGVGAEVARRLQAPAAGVAARRAAGVAAAADRA